MMTVEDRSYNYIAFYLTFGNVYCNILIEHTVFDSPGFEPRLSLWFFFVFFSFSDPFLSKFYCRFNILLEHT